MAKRIFNSTIIESDAFMDMPLSAQMLYIHLNMSADNDGFVEPRRVVRMTGAANDDLQILFAKRFLLAFDSGVAVIKHWWINNTKRADRYAPTSRQKELEMLEIKNNNAYSKKSEQMAINTEVGMNPARILAPMQLNAAQLNTTQHNTIKPGEPDLAERPGNSEVNEMFDYWQEQMGYDIKSKRQKNRFACNNLLKAHGLAGLKKAVQGVVLASQDRFAPRIADFSELQSKWNELMLWGKKKQLVTKARVI